MKIMVVFYSLRVCPWIPGERKNFPLIFQENFEIQDGRQRSHDHPIEKTNFKNVFLHIAISAWSCYGSEKSIIKTLLNLIKTLVKYPEKCPSTMPGGARGHSTERVNHIVPYCSINNWETLKPDQTCQKVFEHHIKNLQK
jgi:hypothetical protein